MLVKGAIVSPADGLGDRKLNNTNGHWKGIEICQCSDWGKFCQNDDVFVSVTVHVVDTMAHFQCPGHPNNVDNQPKIKSPPILKSIQHPRPCNS